MFRDYPSAQLRRVLAGRVRGKGLTAAHIVTGCDTKTSVRSHRCRQPHSILAKALTHDFGQQCGGKEIGDVALSRDDFRFHCRQ
jgi:hypothetical protein